MNNLIIFDRDKELVLTLYVPAIKLEEVGENRPILELLSVTLHKSTILRKSMVFEKIIKLQRTFGTEEVEDKRGRGVEERKKKWDKRVTNQTILAIFLGKLRENNNMHRLIVL